MIVLKAIVKVICGFGSDWTDLLVAACVSGDEQDRDAQKLSACEFSYQTNEMLGERRFDVPCPVALCLVLDTDTKNTWLQSVYAPYQTR